MTPRFFPKSLLAGIAATIIGIGTGWGQEAVRPPAVPVEPVESILNAFASHDLVALTPHGYEEEFDFLTSLLRTPSFQAAVDDIVVEFGSSRYQDVMDRFVGGEEVAYDELKDAWQQTTQPHHVSDPPIYEEFFRVVREINASIPEEDQLRVVLAEPPIDWSLIEDFEDLLPWLQQRFPFEAEVVEREVLVKNRKALLLSGAGHYLNGTPLLQTITARGHDLFKIWIPQDYDLAVAQPSVSSWPTPSFAVVSGTVIGTVKLDTGIAPAAPLEEEYDAVLYLGSPSSLTPARIAPELCGDEEYLRMRLPRLRMAAKNGAPGWLEEFNEYCNSVTGAEPTTG